MNNSNNAQERVLTILYMQPTMEILKQRVTEAGLITKEQSENLEFSEI